nr:replication protein A 70 kDa DNA-binding subunit B [Tanacetum cinerariifolium]
MHKALLLIRIMKLQVTQYAFKVAIDDYNVKKLLPVFTVLHFSNDQEIINSVLACATPIKDNEATSNTSLETGRYAISSDVGCNVFNPSWLYVKCMHGYAVSFDGYGVLRLNQLVLLC